MLLKNYRKQYLDKPQNHMIHACAVMTVSNLGCRFYFNDLDVGAVIESVPVETSNISF